MLFYDSSAESYVESMASAFTEFLDSSSDMAFRVDELGYIKYANHAMEPALGYDRAELVGKEMRMLYPSIGLAREGTLGLRQGRDEDRQLLHAPPGKGRKERGDDQLDQVLQDRRLVRIRDHRQGARDEEEAQGAGGRAGAAAEHHKQADRPGRAQEPVHLQHIPRAEDPPHQHNRLLEAALQRGLRPAERGASRATYRP